MLRPIGRPGRTVRVVDAIGVGDAFTSGLLSALARAGAHDAATLAATDLSAALDEAILSQRSPASGRRRSAYHRRGCRPPRLSD